MCNGSLKINLTKNKSHSETFPRIVLRRKNQCAHHCYTEEPTVIVNSNCQLLLLARKHFHTKKIKEKSHSETFPRIVLRRKKLFFAFKLLVLQHIMDNTAARPLMQTKWSFKSFLVRSCLALTMEHNFMLSQKGWRFSLTRSTSPTSSA